MMADSDATTETPDPEEGPAEICADDEVAQVCADLVRHDILVLRHLTSVLPELRVMAEGGDTDRVAHAARCAMTAACERLGRLCRRDLPIHRA